MSRVCKRISFKTLNVYLKKADTSFWLVIKEKIIKAFYQQNSPLSGSLSVTINVKFLFTLLLQK